MYLSKDQTKGHVRVIVTAGEQERPLRDADIRTNLDLDEIIDPYPLANPNIIPRPPAARDA